MWSTEPGAYRSRCQVINGADVLEMRSLGGAPTPTPSPDLTWGLHLLDANIGLGNLISIVSREATAFAARGAAPRRP